MWKPSSLYGAGGGIAALIVDGLYLAAIEQQGATPPGGRVAFVAAWVGAAGVIGLLGAFETAPGRRAVTLGIAAAMLFAMGVPAIFSFGGAVLLCAAVVAIGAGRAAEGSAASRWVVLGAPLALMGVAGVGVAVGFRLTGF